MPERNLNATCLTCPYHHLGGGSLRPHCRRNAVALISGSVALSATQHAHSAERFAGAFPTTLPAPDCWCGEHPDFFTGA